MQTPLVSIIIPTYNRANIIGETLDSILAQTYTNWECIVVDDGSTDKTFELLSKYIKKDSRFQYFKRPQDRIKGPNSCRNYGFEISKGTFINFFDSDDIYYPETLEKVIEKANNSIDAVVVKTEVIDYISKKVISRNIIFSEKFLEDYFIGKITFFVGGGFWKRSYLKTHEDIFDENIGNMDDWDFNLRMLYKNPKLVFVDEVLMKYMNHSDSYSKELGKLNKKELISEFRAREKNYELIKNIVNVDIKVIKGFILRRYNKYLKIALFKNDSLKYYLFKRLLRLELKFNCYDEFLKTIIGFCLFVIFKRGYKFLKD